MNHCRRVPCRDSVVAANTEDGTTSPHRSTHRGAAR
ncbi:hypothetical protein PICSAR240_01031 [Mycobacterium avium subsp. paratuberculosis]|jgi:hypothetical protein|nr:hypothetical protein X425_02631 [Mycobacterium avium XTB13-223]OUZ03337.1 hypothetical protein B0172_02625 [Mycobacterium avium subsp. paratuberculosis]QGW34517.1 hypothetical protein MAA44156_04371 [Mycobacterium avium subsp. avium]OVF05185.1 hypothetical protein B0173_00909 [Mycobacterium avium subsp. paratuberculosis]QKU43582.1 hypothetical protein MAP44135_0098 [Mycobacterium avium subsp. paratuberculosis]